MVIGVFEGAVELRCSGKVDGFGLNLRLRESQTAHNDATVPVRQLVVHCRKVSRAMFPAVLSDHRRIGAALMQRCRCESPETLHDFLCMGENILEG